MKCDDCDISEISNKLPKKLKHLNCAYNNIKEIPISLLNIFDNIIPRKLGYFYFVNHMDDGHILTDNEVDSIFTRYLYGESPNFYSNPVYIKIFKTYRNNTRAYLEAKLFKQKATIIGDWFLECKYNPKYKYCSNRLLKEYEELYKEI